MLLVIDGHVAWSENDIRKSRSYSGCQSSWRRRGRSTSWRSITSQMLRIWTTSLWDLKKYQINIINCMFNKVIPMTTCNIQSCNHTSLTTYLWTSWTIIEDFRQGNVIFGLFFHWLWVDPFWFMWMMLLWMWWWIALLLLWWLLLLGRCCPHCIIKLVGICYLIPLTFDIIIRMTIKLSVI